MLAGGSDTVDGILLSRRYRWEMLEDGDRKARRQPGFMYADGYTRVGSRHGRCGRRVTEIQRFNSDGRVCDASPPPVSERSLHLSPRPRSLGHGMPYCRRVGWLLVVPLEDRLGAVRVEDSGKLAEGETSSQKQCVTSQSRRLPRTSLFHNPCRDHLR